MNLHTLTQHAANSEIRELELLSLEGGVYLARIRLDDGQFTLLDEAAQPMHLRSIPHLRQVLHTVPAFPCVLALRARRNVRPRYWACRGTAHSVFALHTVVNTKSTRVSG